MVTHLDDPPPKPVLTVTDVKNWVYCQRVPYYSTFLPRRPTTFKMDDGQGRHEEAVELEERRSLRPYGLVEGERVFRVRLFSERLGVSGLLDMAIIVAQEALPIEYKTTTGTVGQNHKLQLTLYGMLVEGQWGRPVQRGFIYLIPQRRACEVVITDELRQQVQQALADIRAMLISEAKPPATQVRQRCVDCEFRRYCPDIH